MSFLDQVLGAGADIVQLREKDAEAGDLLRWGALFREVTRRHDALFMVNDRADVARALHADGVHLGQNDLPVAVAREIVGPEALIGLSCHSPADHANAAVEADYLTAGPIWSTPTKPGRAATGLGLVRSAAASVDRPWFAIGGVDAMRMPELTQAGATRIAVVRAIGDASDPAEATRGLLAGLEARPALSAEPKGRP